MQKGHVACLDHRDLFRHIALVFLKAVGGDHHLLQVVVALLQIHGMAYREFSNGQVLGDVRYVLEPDRSGRPQRR